MDASADEPDERSAWETDPGARAAAYRASWEAARNRTPELIAELRRRNALIDEHYPQSAD